MCPSNPDRLYQQNHCGIYRIDRPSDTWVRIGRAMPKRIVTDELPTRFPRLLSPLRLRGLTLRNRIVSTAHGTFMSEGGLPTARIAAYQEARARGGVGLIMCQWGKHLGATVIGTVGSDDKVALAKKAGCKHVIVSTREKISERVRAITQGAMVPVVYDSVGKDTFQATIDSLQPFGLFVSFGNASGPVPPVALTALKGSLYITRPSLMAHIASRENIEAISSDLFKMVASGKVTIPIDQRYKLSEAVKAHNDLESRRTTGCTVLLP